MVIVRLIVALKPLLQRRPFTQEPPRDSVATRSTHRRPLIVDGESRNGRGTVRLSVPYEVDFMSALEAQQESESRRACRPDGSRTVSTKSTEKIAYPMRFSIWRAVLGWGFFCIGCLALIVSLGSVVLPMIRPADSPGNQIGQIPGHLVMAVTGVLLCLSGLRFRYGSWKRAAVLAVAAYLLGVLAYSLTWPGGSM